MRFTIGRLITALVLLASAAAAVWALMPRLISAETATVARGEFVATVDEDGKTRVRERYVVAAPLSGRLSRVRLKVGDQVGADDVVAIIAPSPARFWIRAPVVRWKNVWGPRRQQSSEGGGSRSR